MAVYFWLIAGFVFLLTGADFLIKGAVELADRMHVSKLIVGLTIVAIGTSLPELVVNMIANVNGNTDLILGNIFGSNLANMLLIIGAAAVIRPLIVKRQIVWVDIPIYLGVSIILFSMMNNHILVEGKTAQLTPLEGYILLFLFFAYLYYSYYEKKNINGINHQGKMSVLQKIGNVFRAVRGIFQNEREREIAKSVVKSGMLILFGSIALFWGGGAVVDSAVSLVSSFHISETLIGLTVVAIGTSLPELVTSVVAAFKKNDDIAVGNIIGSNIINIVLILGLTMATGSIKVSSENNGDLFVMVISAFIFMSFLFIGTKYTLKRWQGLLFLLIYFSYIVLRLT